MRITIDTIHSDSEAVAFTTYPSGERVITIATDKQKQVLDSIYELLKVNLGEDEKRT